MNISASPTRNHIEFQADPEFEWWTIIEPAQMMARVPMPFSTIVLSSRAPSVVILDDAARVSVSPCVPLEPMKIPTRKSNLTHTLCAEECPINSLFKSLTSGEVTPKNLWIIRSFHFGIGHCLSCIHRPGTWKWTNRRRCIGPQEGVSGNVGTFDSKDPVQRHIMFWWCFRLVCMYIFSSRQFG